ncbi:MAG: MFS transporter [Chloroflexota bacterium]
MANAAAPDRNLSGYTELIQRNRNFRFLWLGQIVSLLGDWFNLIASASLVATLTQSGVAIGGLFVVRMLAPFLMSPIAGVVADRYNRKWVLIITDLARAVTLLGFLLVRRPEHVWLLYTLTAVQLGISGFFFPTRNAILPDIVSRRELGAANALSSVTWSVMLALGAALGGIVAGEWGVYPSFVIDSLTFMLSAVLIAQVAYDFEGAPADLDTSVGAAVREYVEGLRYLWGHKDFLVIGLHKGAYSLVVVGAFQVIQVTLAEQVFVIGQGGGTGLGLMYAAIGVGTGLGPIAARRYTGDRGSALRAAISVSYVVTAVGMVVVATLANFGTVLFGIFLRGVGTGIAWVFSTQLLLQLLPDSVRGRVFSTEFAMFTLMNATGAASIGWFMDAGTYSLDTLLWGMAVLTLLPGVLWLLWLSFGERIEEPPGEEALSAAPHPGQPAAPAGGREHLHQP